MSKSEDPITVKAQAYARSHKKQIARKIIDGGNYLSEESPVSVFMAGSPGAGKTEASKALIEGLNVEVLRIDPDELRAQFVDYNGRNSSLFQRPVSTLVEKLHDMALSRSLSFILDGTLSKFDKAKKNIERSLKKGRSVQILYVYQSPFTAWEFVQAREKDEGRSIPVESFIDQYFEARDTVNRLKHELGQSIRVDVLFKDYASAKRLYKAGVDDINYHIPERFTRDQLEAALSVV